jgi:Uma2 family endonuclease
MTNLLDEPALRSRIMPITPEQYHAMGDAGIIGANVELINGFILEKIAKSPLHAFVATRLLTTLSEASRESLFIRQQDPLELGASDPEPDLAVVYGRPEDYRLRHPTGDEVALVVEVAISSLALDRKKAEIYAEATIPCYWLVNVEKRCVEVYERPQNGVYVSCTILSGGDVLTVPFNAEHVIGVDSLFS